jgi:hypothetical protein
MLQMSQVLTRWSEAKPSLDGMLELPLMDQKLRDHIKNCLEHASESQIRAGEISDPGLKADFLSLEKQWLSLAQSYVLSEKIEQFLVYYSKTRMTEWRPISSAPFDRDLELAVIGPDGPDPLAFPCRRILSGWINAETKERVDVVRPTHWREWTA